MKRTTIPPEWILGKPVHGRIVGADAVRGGARVNLEFMLEEDNSLLVEVHLSSRKTSIEMLKIANYRDAFGEHSLEDAEFLRRIHEVADLEHRVIEVEGIIKLGYRDNPYFILKYYKEVGSSTAPAVDELEYYKNKCAQLTGILSSMESDRDSLFEQLQRLQSSCSRLVVQNQELRAAYMDEVREGNHMRTMYNLPLHTANVLQFEPPEELVASSAPTYTCNGMPRDRLVGNQDDELVSDDEIMDAYRNGQL